jgi:hypothetical protein
VVNIREKVVKLTATCRKCAKECRLRRVAWCNVKGQTEGGRTKIKRKLKFKNSQKQNGLLDFVIHFLKVEEK